MYNRFHIILAIFIFCIMYLLYKIVAFKVEEFRTDNFTDAIIAKNTEIEIRNNKKEATEKYIYTNAYKTQVAKATQNKNLPGEEIINIISQEDMDGNVDLNVNEVFSEVTKTQDDPTLKMSNPEKWQYLFQNGLKHSVK